MDAKTKKLFDINTLEGYVRTKVVEDELAFSGLGTDTPYDLGALQDLYAECRVDTKQLFDKDFSWKDFQTLGQEAIDWYWPHARPVHEVVNQLLELDGELGIVRIPQE